LESRTTFALPAQSRELVEDALHPDVLAGIVSVLGGKWVQHKRWILGKLIGDGQVAQLNLVNWGAPFGDTESLFPDKELDRRISTRLGEGDRVATFAEPLVGPFGFKVRELHIPATLIREIRDDAAVQVLRADAGVIEFQYGTESFIYDRWGLRPTSLVLEPEASLISGEEEDD
jgi:hypothetical protein